MKKRIFLGIGTLAAISAPIVGIVSCSKDRNRDENGIIKLKAFTSKKATSSPLDIADSKSDWKTVVTLDGANHTVNDNGFNQQAYSAIGERDAAITKRVTSSVKPSTDNVASFITMYNALAPKTIAVAPGFLHVKPLSSKANGLTGKAAILLDGYVSKNNIASVEFKAYEAAFLGGIQAGFYLNQYYETYKTNGGLKVATFGGLNIPGVISFMIGFQNGIKYFNENLPTVSTRKAEKIIFIDNGGKNDYFSGGFAPGGGKEIAEKLISKGADIILPVSAPQVVDVLKAIKTKGSKTKVIGVDSKQEDEFDANYPDVVIFSILKDLKVATLKILNVVAGVKTATDTGYAGIGGFGKYTIGTLENELVGITKIVTSGTNNDAAYIFAITDITKKAAKDQTLEFKY